MSRLAGDSDWSGRWRGNGRASLAALQFFNDPQGLYARLPLEMEIK